MKPKIISLLIIEVLLLGTLLISGCIGEEEATTEEETSIIDKAKSLIKQPTSEERPEPYVKQEGITAVWEYRNVNIPVTVENIGGAGIVEVRFQAENQGVQTKYIYLDKGETKRISFEIYEAGTYGFRRGRIEYNVTASPASVVYIQGKAGQDHIPGLSRIEAEADVSESGGNQEIWVINSDGSDEKQVAAGEASYRFPSWSPDGTKIVFELSRRSESGFYRSEIWVMDSDGNNQRQLGKGGYSWKNLGNPVWSPDGTKIAYVGIGATTIGTGTKYRIFIMNSNGSGSVYGKNPSWSPDGGKIAFEKWDRAGIWIVNRDGGDIRKQIDDGSYPSWSPDGKKIAFMLKEGGNWDIWVTDIDSGDKRRLTTDEAFDAYPSWSPDGKKIAFISDQAGNYDVRVMNSDGSNRRQLTTAISRDGAPVFRERGGAPSWSPDGEKIAFHSMRYPSFGGVEVDVLFFDEKDRILAFEDISVEVTVKVYTQKIEDTVSPEGEITGFHYVKDRQIYAETVTIDSYKDASSRIGGEKIEIPFDVYDLKEVGIVEVIVHTSKGDFKGEYRI